MGLSSIVLYHLSPKDLKEELRSDPKLFFVLSLGAIAPDFDLFTGLHRSLFHSVFWPLLLIVLAPYLATLRPNSKNLSRNMRLFGFMVLTHMLFDITFGSIALFWPIDTRFYNITMGVRIGLVGWGLFPFTIKGIFMSIDHVSQEVGTDTFFVNWTPERRVEVFRSEFLDIPVSQFTVHATIFLWYLLMVVLPYFKYRRSVRKTTRVTSFGKFMNLSQYRKFRWLITLPIFVFMMTIYIISDTSTLIFRKSKAFLLSIKGNWIQELILILLILASFYAGPYQGEEWKEEQSYRDGYWILTDGMSLNAQRNFIVPSGATVTVTIEFPENPISYYPFVFETDPENAKIITDDTRDLISLLNEGNITTFELIEFYQQNISKSVSVDSRLPVDENTTATWILTSDSDFTIVFGLYSWNASEYFVKTSSTTASWIIPRKDAYDVGLASMLVFSLLFIVDLFIIVNKKNKLNKTT